MRSRSFDDPQRADDLAQVDRHRLAPRDGEDRLFLDLALQRVDGGIGRDHALGELGVAPRSAWIASAISRSASPPISATLRVSSCRSTSKALAVCSFIMFVSASAVSRSGR